MQSVGFLTATFLNNSSGDDDHGAPAGRDVGGAHPIRHTARICDFCKETQQNHPEWGGHGERTRPTLVTTMRRSSASAVIEPHGTL